MYRGYKILGAPVNTIYQKIPNTIISIHWFRSKNKNMIFIHNMEIIVFLFIDTLLNYKKISLWCFTFYFQFILNKQKETYMQNEACNKLFSAMRLYG